MPASLPTISVVIPVYDTGLWTLDAIDSVLEQTRPAAEILLVDDGSAGPTAALLDRAAARHPGLVRVLRHPQNRGLAAARNTGIAAATGDLAVLLDSDDALADPGVLEDAARQYAETGYDMLRLRLRFWKQDPVSGADRRWDDPNDLFIPADLSGVTAAQAPAVFQTRANWQFVYRRGFLAENGIAFDEELRRREDRPFLCHALLKAARIDLSSRTGFLYRQRPGSIMHDPKPEDLAFFTRGVEIARMRVDAAEQTLGPARYVLDLHYLAGLQGLCAPFLKEGEEEAVRAALARFRAVHLAGLPDAHPGLGPEAAGFFTSAWPAGARQGRFPPAVETGLENGWLGAVHAALLEGEGAAVELFWAACAAGRGALASGAADRRLAARTARAAAGEAAAEAPPAPRRRGAARTKLLLHIGLTKTGSTSLQNFLELNRARLLDRDVVYPEAGIYREPGSERGSGHNMAVRELFRDGERPVFEAMLEEIRGAKLGIVSCENLSWNADWRSPAGVQALARAFAEFDVTVLMVVRDEFDWLASMYKEAVAGGWLRFGDGPDAFLRLQDALGGLDFRGILDGFAAGFGADACRMIELAGEGELARRALAEVDPDLAADPGLLTPARANEGVADELAAALRLLNRLPPEGEVERGFMAMARAESFDPPDLFPAVEASLDAVAALRAASGRAEWSAAARAKAAARLEALSGSPDLRRAAILLTERMRWGRGPAAAPVAAAPAETAAEPAPEPAPLTSIERMLEHAAGEEERRLRRFGAPRPYGFALRCDADAAMLTVEASRPIGALRLVWDRLDAPDSAEDCGWRPLGAGVRAAAVPVPRRRFLTHARLTVYARAGKQVMRREVLLAAPDGAPMAIVVGGEGPPAAERPAGLRAVESAS